ncbi:DUF3027 domain-containing protein [Nakamurella sp. A5-74]|uniref:DUF3027 domain-containing protein n=1 Tax=Nakamurella sp. A5-74 TaxID=3158264 RepID=A0AAU8DP03_9ACTN
MISTDDVPTDEQVETAGSAPVADESQVVDETRVADETRVVDESPVAENDEHTADRGAPLSRQAVALTTAAIELALAAARSVAGDEAGGVESVGDFLGAYAEDGIAVTAGFQAKIRGYHGWQWSVTLASVSTDSWTVSEVVLLPGDAALVAPPWVPWDRRVRGGDLGVGDLLLTPTDDPRLVPGYLLSDDPAIEDVARDFGLGRTRVLSRDGRVDAAERWYAGPFGPSDPMAQQAPGRCGQCGFFVPLAGALGGLFGACSNDMAPGDGKVVAVEYGCGAHSEAVAAILEPSGPGESDSTLIDGLRIDEERIDMHVREQAELADVGSARTLLDEPTEPVAAEQDPVDGAVEPGAGQLTAAQDMNAERILDAEPEPTAGLSSDADADQDPADGQPTAANAQPAAVDPDEDSEQVAGANPDEDAALHAVLELLPPISSSVDVDSTGSDDADPDAGVVTV